MGDYACKLQIESAGRLTFLSLVHFTILFLVFSPEVNITRVEKYYLDSITSRSSPLLGKETLFTRWQILLLRRSTSCGLRLLHLHALHRTGMGLDDLSEVNAIQSVSTCLSIWFLLVFDLSRLRISAICPGEDSSPPSEERILILEGRRCSGMPVFETVDSS